MARCEITNAYVNAALAAESYVNAAAILVRARVFFKHIIVNETGAFMFVFQIDFSTFLFLLVYWRSTKKTVLIVRKYFLS